MAVKVGKIILFAMLLLVAMAFIIILSPLIALVLIVYIIFALPREQRFEHERKMQRILDGLPSIKKRNGFSNFLDKLPKMGSF